MAKRIVIMGAPGAGKGSQVSIIKEKYDIDAIVTGDLLRRHVSDKTDIGRAAAAYMNEGKLVPDDIIIDMIREEMKGKDSFILDGFPRTVVQAEALDRMLEEMQLPLTVAILLSVDDEIIVKRLTSRFVCSGCGKIFSSLREPVKEGDKCSDCGASIIRRKDDNEETIKERLRVYREQTFPVVEYYRRKGILKEVDGTGTPQEVFERIDSLLGE